jgi:1-acyl-sn-glycerol-3-phosphate acyltransferase
MTAMRLALSLLYWAFLAISLFLIFPISVVIWLISLPFDPRRVTMHRLTSLWGWLYTACNPAWRIEVRGRENFRPDEVYVVVANHQSLVDILVLFRVFRHFKWVSKVENFRIPVVGQVMRMNRYIELVRGQRESIRKMMRECERTLQQGSSVLIFPEGTRSESGDLRPFKPGAFELARSTARPILPIVLEGTARALPKRGFVLQGRHQISVDVLEEIPADDFKDLDTPEISRMVRDRIASHLETLRSAHGRLPGR